MPTSLSSLVDPKARSTENAVALGECVYKKVYADVFYLYTCALTPVAFLGIFLNSINLIVLRNMQKTSLTSVFLLRLLAGCDILFLFICLVYFFVRHMVVYHSHPIEVFARPDLYIGAEIFHATLPLYFISLQNRNWLVVLITLERFFNIVFPLWARGHCTKSNLSKVYVVIVCVSFLCHLPRYWSNYLDERINPCTGFPELQIVISKWNKIIATVYIAALVFVPLFLIYIMNITLIITLRRSMRKRSAMTEGGLGKDTAESIHATVMIISLAIVYTICETPASMDLLASLAGVKYADDSLYYNYSRKIGLLLVVVDSSINFVAYCSSNRTFRQAFFHIFGNCQGIMRP